MTQLALQDRDDPPPGTNKNVFHCPECDYSDPLEEWVFETREDGEVMLCPGCDHLIDHRSPTTH